MAEAGGWNVKIIDEFRSNGGQVGGNFAGAPVTLLHHVGRKSGKQSVAPVMYLRDTDDPATIYVFASYEGAKTNPAWFYNLTTAGTATVELGRETFDVTVEEVTGEERDRIYTEQASRFPGFAEYEEKTKGVRTIPVLALRRLS
ncbi:MAG: nitroreductase family deazaflavin-dependent oxidoreductase [Nakamurella sp.]